jgi:hypothetical protein
MVLTNIKLQYNDICNLTGALTFTADISDTDNDLKKNTDQGKKSCVVIVLDKSASMSGTEYGSRYSILDMAKESIKKLVNKLHEDCDIIFVAYAGYKSDLTSEADVESYNFSYHTTEDMLETIDNIKAGGGTSFVVAFNAVSNMISQLSPYKYSKLDMVFFTDGFDTTGIPKDVIEKSFQKLLTKVKIKFCNSKIHSVGIGSTHDALFLDRIMSALPGGTFSYVESIDDFELKLSNLVSIISEQQYIIKITNPRLNTESEFIICKNSPNPSELVAHVFLPLESFIGENNIWDLHIRNTASKVLEFSGFDMEISFATNYKSTYYLVQQCELLELYMSNLMISLVCGLNNISNNFDIIATNSHYAEQLRVYIVDSLKPTVFQHKNKSVRHAINNFYDKFAVLIKNFLDNYQKIMGEDMEILTNKEIFAKVNNNAYECRNMNLAQNIYKDIEQENSKINATKYDLIEIYETNKSKLDIIGECYMTSSNVFELINDEDCLCVSLNISVDKTKQIHQTDFSNIQINNIFPLKLSASVFKDTSSWVLQNSSSKTDILSTTIIEGPNKEQINGVLPLYLFAEHWKNAKTWMKLLLDKNPVLPYLVLEKLLKICIKGDFQPELKDILELVFETCVQIYKDNTAAIFSYHETVTKLRDTFNDYFIGPEYRSAKHVPNNSLFLINIMIAQEMKDMKLLSEESTEDVYFKQMFLQEEMRRNMIKPFYEPFNDVMASYVLTALLNIDKTKWVDNHVEHYKKINGMLDKKQSLIGENIQIIKKKSKTATNKFINNDKKNDLDKVEGLIDSESDYELDSDSEVDFTGINRQTQPQTSTAQTIDNIKTPEFSNPEEWTLDYSYENLPDAVVKAFTTLDNLFVNKEIQLTMSFFKYISKPSTKQTLPLDADPDPIAQPILPTLTTLGLDTVEKKLAFIIQLNANLTDLKWNQAISKSELINPFDQTEATTYLKKIFVKCVTDDKERLIEYCRTEYLCANVEDRAKIFGASSSEIEAAAAIYGSYIGKGDIVHFAKNLQKERCPLALFKINLLLSTHYKGIQLFADGVRDKRKLGWKAKKKHCFRFWKRNHDLLTSNEWQTLFSDNWKGSMESIKAWYRLYKKTGDQDPFETAAKANNYSTYSRLCSRNPDFKSVYGGYYDGDY